MQLTKAPVQRTLGSGLRSRFHVGPAKPEFLHRTIVLRCPNDCKKPRARVRFGGELPRIL